MTASESHLRNLLKRKLPEQVTDVMTALKPFLDDIDDLRRQVAIAREALEFYGDERNYDWDITYRNPHVGTHPVHADEGEKAREAIAKMEGK